jgi:hypothetical protein
MKNIELEKQLAKEEKLRDFYKQIIFDLRGKHIFYTKKELAIIIGKSIGTIDRLIATNKCPEYHKVSSTASVDFPLDSIIDYIIVHNRVKSTYQ